ncbi:hypothetical protein [Propionivibrio sp.]|uniref:hypothetical protein n=1 Tax=Propionivibrio sp. TaxID=2212460 RepID=UPI0039E53BC2
MHVAQGRRHDLDLRMLLDDAVDHAEKGARIELGFRGHLRPGDAQAFLQVLLVADQHVDVLENPVEHRHGPRLPAGHVPQLGPVVQVERHHGAGRLGGLHAFHDDVRRRLGKRREDAAAMEPAHAAGEDFLPVEIARLEQAAGLVGAVVEDDGRTHAKAAVAIDRGHVRPAHPVVLETLVEGLHAHGADRAVDQLADGIIDHGRHDARLHAEAVRQVGRAVELAAAHVNPAFCRLAERHHPGVQTVDERPERNEVQRPPGKN